MTAKDPSILLIDDEKASLERLTRRVRKELEGVTIRPWYPREEENPAETFRDLVDDSTVLVVTDYDLSKAVKGFFGYSVVAWCRSLFIPVGDFSRGHIHELSAEPDLFELRVPREEGAAVKFIVRIYEGFARIRLGIEKSPALLSKGHSPAQVLAGLLGRIEMESQLAPYLSRPGLFNASLLEALKRTEHESESVKVGEKTKLLTYILGHVLVNAVLKYPGPILAEGPFCAYLATSDEAMEQISGLFDSALYEGPFDGGERLFWRDKVDEVIELLASKFDVRDSAFESFGDYHRAVVTKSIGGPLAAHDCKRCDGAKGGYWCPFRKRAVCEQSDCSSTASSWVPSGAFACRVERDFFDEWSPILGL